jgi:hypothetical protein
MPLWPIVPSSSTAGGCKIDWKWKIVGREVEIRDSRKQN